MKIFKWGVVVILLAVYLAVPQQVAAGCVVFYSGGPNFAGPWNDECTTDGGGSAIWDSIF